MTLTIMLLSVSLFTSMMLIIAMNPITMGVLILLMALTLAMIYGLTLSSWIAFLLFLIYVSGMLVMFAYFVALSPNQQMNKFIMMPSITFILMVTMAMMWTNMYPNMTPTFQYLMNTFYTNMNIPMLIMLATILFLAMVVVVKIVTNNKGPLRPFMKYV